MTYFQCPYCKRNYKLKKSHNDNSWYVRRHSYTIPHSNNLGLTILPGEKIKCPGSNLRLLGEPK